MCVFMRGGEGVRNEVERKLCFGFRESVCMCVCMCVCEREREREREVGSGKTHKRT